MNNEFRAGPFVTRRINQLIGADPSRLSPNSKAMLAQLRQAAGSEPGTVPSVWAITLEGIPAELPRGQRERAEKAIHTALTQFAVHQQSRGRAMHDPRQPFGRAVRRLAEISNKAEPHESPVYARFTAMSTATSLPGLLAHSRGLITQLRTHEIGFDYGRYADDLYWFLNPTATPDTHRRWGRDFHYLTNSETNEGASA